MSAELDFLLNLSPADALTILGKIAQIFVLAWGLARLRRIF